MEFRRITGLPPYVFTIIDGLKVEARRAGQDVIDLGFGNPDLPSSPVAVEKLAEAARNPRNHRYSSSRGIPKLREAVADLYIRRFGVALDPEAPLVQGGDGLAQLGDPAAGRVAVVAAVGSRLGQLAHGHVGRGQVRVAEAEVDHVDAGPPSIHLQPVDDGEDVRRKAGDPPELHPSRLVRP